MRSLVSLATLVIVASAATSPVYGQLLERLERQLKGPGTGSDTSAADAGTLPPPAEEARPTLGLYISEKKQPDGGVKVDDVLAGGPAAKAGIRAGDLITQVNGKPVSSIVEFAELLADSKIGDKATFTVNVLGREKKIDVTFAAAPAEEPADDEPATTEPSTTTPPRTTPPAGELPPRSPAATEGDAPLELGPAGPGPRMTPPRPGEIPPPESDRPAPTGDEPAFDPSGRPTLGVTVGPITEEAIRRYGVPTRRGALILAIRPQGPADSAGVPIGGVVVAIDGVRIDTADQLVDAIRTSAPGQEVELTYYNGADLTRKTIRLGSAGPAPEGVGPQSPRTNRIDLTARPDDASWSNAATRGIPAAGTEADELAALRRENEMLRAQIRDLEERLKRTGAAGDAATPAAADTPPRFTPPTFNPPPTP